MPSAIATPPPPAPPAAPAPAPAPTPSPAPAAPAAPPSPPPPPDEIRAFDQRLEDAFDKAAPIAKKPPEAKPAAPAQPKPAETPKAAEPPKPAELPKPGPKDPKELRNELTRVSGELQTKAKQITDMEAKIKDYEAKGKDATVLTERLSTLEKQLEEIQAENRVLKHESSPEFKQKFEVPFSKMADRATRFIETLTVNDMDANVVRKGKREDLVNLHQVYKNDPNKALAMAQQMFGEATSLVTPYLTRLRDMEEEAADALAEERTHYKQREEAEAAKKITATKELRELYDRVSKELGEGVDDYHDSPEDKELVSTRDEALKLFDAKPADLQARVIKNAHIRHRFAAFSVEKMKRLRAEKRIAELQTELETYKNEAPNPNRRTGGKESGAGQELSWEQEARKVLT